MHGSRFSAPTLRAQRSRIHVLVTSTELCQPSAFNIAPLILTPLDISLLPLGWNIALELSAPFHFLSLHYLCILAAFAWSATPFCVFILHFTSPYSLLCCRLVPFVILLYFCSRTGKLFYYFAFLHFVVAVRFLLFALFDRFRFPSFVA